MGLQNLNCNLSYQFDGSPPEKNKFLWIFRRFRYGTLKIIPYETLYTGLEQQAMSSI